MEHFKQFENNEPFNKIDAILEEEEQKELNSLREKQAHDMPFSDNERKRFLFLQEKETSIKNDSEITKEEREKHRELTYKENLTEEEQREIIRIQTKINRSKL